MDIIISYITNINTNSQSILINSITTVHINTNKILCLLNKQPYLKSCNKNSYRFGHLKSSGTNSIVSIHERVDEKVDGHENQST